jgi:hypothetical protein
MMIFPEGKRRLWGATWDAHWQVSVVNWIFRIHCKGWSRITACWTVYGIQKLGSHWPWCAEGVVPFGLSNNIQSGKRPFCCLPKRPNKVFPQFWYVCLSEISPQFWYVYPKFWTYFSCLCCLPHVRSIFKLKSFNRGLHFSRYRQCLQWSLLKSWDVSNKYPRLKTIAQKRILWVTSLENNCERTREKIETYNKASLH